jgi:hypothetical protein
MITVADIMEPLGPDLMMGESTRISHDKLYDEANKADLKYDPRNRISLVFKNDEVVGYSTMDLLNSDTTIGKDGTVIQIDPTKIVSANTELFTFLATARIIDETHHIVNDATSYVGTVNINRFSKLPFRLCLLALMLNLEDTILRLAMSYPDKALRFINTGYAESIFRKKYGRPWDYHSYFELLECTNFSNKCTILNKICMDDDLSELLELAVEIRNNCAHSAPSEEFLKIMNHRALWEFTRKLRALNHELRKMRWDGIRLVNAH